MSAIGNIGKLQEALRTIKEECKGHGNSCIACPFEVSGKCGITCESVYGDGEWRKKPQYWIIPDIRLMIPPKEQ